MKRILIVYGVLLVIFITVTSFRLHSYFASKDKYPTDLAECLKKYKSDWGIECPGCTSKRDTYAVFIKNTCDLPLDIKIAVQNKNKTLKIFEKENFAGEDTIMVFSCEGTGKYFKLAKKAGDREIVFPSNAEMSKMYNK